LLFELAPHIEFDIVTSDGQKENLDGKPRVGCNFHFGVDSPDSSDRAEGEL
jgi:hypothetical protein